MRIAAQTPALPPLQLRRRDPFALAIVNGRKKSEILTAPPPGYVDGETVRVLVLRSRSRVRLAGKVSDLCAGKVLRGARGGTCVYEMVGLVSMRRRCTVSRDAAGAWPAAVANAVSEWPSPLRAAGRAYLARLACATVDVFENTDAVPFPRRRFYLVSQRGIVTWSSYAGSDLLPVTHSAVVPS